MLGYLLARAGVRVTVLEKHADFLRDFRGDTVHPSTLEIMVELGLIDAFLKLPHQRVERIGGLVGETPVAIADFTHLPVRERYVAMMPQWDFLNFIAKEAARYPGFTLHTSTQVTDLVRRGETVVGVKARGPGGEQEFLADLVVAADGRASVVREKAGLESENLGAPMDVLWFKLPVKPGEAGQTMGRFGAGSILVLLNRGDYWQCAFVIPKGSLQALKAAGLDAFRETIKAASTFDRERLDALTSWDDVKLLTVRVDRLLTWYWPGLLCIGDAAHAMSPIGGVGVNLAVQDAVAAANILALPLRNGTVGVADLAAVQKRRMFPTRVTQSIQIAMQNTIISGTLKLREQPKPPLALRLLQWFPVLQRLPARVLGLGVRRESVSDSIRVGNG
jgi:2-polyprenyl-6-methoxyphenol hydroxylase-like FAD-dependent oxidoreductase